MKKFMFVSMILLCFFGIVNANIDAENLSETYISTKKMNDILKYADTEILVKVSNEVGSTTKEKFIRTYCKYDSSFKKTLEENFYIKVD